MHINKMNNVVVLKGMSSNVVEEAIVVLKPNIKIKQIEHINKNVFTPKEKSRRKIILDEAEDVINNYINNIQSQNRFTENKKLVQKCKKLETINILLFISVIVCIFKIIL